MDEAWKQLPCAAVIVCASVLASPSASAQPAEADASPRQPDIEQNAPTCGSACHGGGDEIQHPDPNSVPPPAEPKSKPGCTVEDADDSSPLALAALSLGLIAGVGSRRRRERDESKS